MTRALALGLVVIAACSDGDPIARSEAERQCDDAFARTGQLECLHRIASESDWSSVSVPLQAVEQVRSTKYMLPARPDARLRPLFMNASRHELHFEFLVEVFPELFPGLTARKYLDLLFDPARCVSTWWAR